MDHKEYEENMMKFVNRHTAMAEKARLEAHIAAEEARVAVVHCQKINAGIKIGVWIATFLCAMVVMFYLNWLGIAPPELPAAICGVVGLVTGLRVNALARAFRK